MMNEEGIFLCWLWERNKNKDVPGKKEVEGYFFYFIEGGKKKKKNSGKSLSETLMPRFLLSM